ncbi:hypothetical protein AX14_012861, partial [Amanita brunnescens Koide BX004]
MASTRVDSHPLSPGDPPSERPRRTHPRSPPETFASPSEPHPPTQTQTQTQSPDDLNPRYPYTTTTTTHGLDPTKPDLDPVAARVLATKWHESSDDAVRAAASAVSTLLRDRDAHPDLNPNPNPNRGLDMDRGHGDGDGAGDVDQGRAYRAALRILSAAYHRLASAREELEESRRALREKEGAVRARAAAVLGELAMRPSEQDVARRIFQAIFTDDDEGLHDVRRRQSVA